MTPSPAAVDVQVATDEDLREAIDDVPQAAGVSLEELREQAEASRFTSEDAESPGSCLRAR